MATIYCDTHVHIYPKYNVALCLRSALARLKQLSKEEARSNAALVLCLTERYDCFFCREVQERGSISKEEFQLVWNPQRKLIEVLHQPIVILPGRQIVTREKLEVLALTVDSSIEDGLPVETVLGRVRDEGGVPVLPWSPGKWWFQRGDIVSRIVATELESSHLLLGDTALRPTLWPEPALLKTKRNGFAITVAGSDPLPLPGEELRVGSYMSRTELDDGREFEIETLRTAREWKSVGARLSVLEVARRIRALRNARA